ncbi:MAG: CDP-glycerol glycerophosphotransferase family protein [Bacteroidales bacterium]|nr:CDP-glycerol glycerophosphotransferase family protein [Bacteroidales bacterium]
MPYLIWFIPRSPKIWVYGGRNGKFVDNTKYWFIWANQNLRNIKHIWITNDSETLKNLKNSNYLAFKPFSVRGLYYIIRGKIFYYTHGASSIVRPIFLVDGIKFDFFHGIPMKTMRLEKTGKFSQASEPKFRWSVSKKLYHYYKTRYTNSDYLIIPSRIYLDQFDGYPGERIFEGYPRNIVFQLSVNELLEIIQLSQADVQFYQEISSYSRRYIYMPTFREGCPDFITGAFRNLEELNTLMLEQQAVFLLKLHPYTKTSVDFSAYSNIKVVNNEMDIYPFLPFIDCLISDYSSISMDFYFSNHPVIFYMFDLESYVGTSRELDFNPQKLAGNSTALTWEELIGLIADFDHIPSLKDQSGNGHFGSQIVTDLPKLALYIKENILR